MFPLKNTIPLLVLIVCNAIAIFWNIYSEKLAAIAIIVCFFYVCIQWILSVNKRIADDVHKQCILKNQSRNVGGLLNGGCLDVWHLYHLLFWMLIGILAPNRMVLVILLSILWESFEGVSFYIGLKVFPNIRQAPDACKGVFCGRVEDVFINIAGYCIGVLIYVARSF